jgi:ribosomal-protein-alanine N-acetyltransferase
LPGSTITIQQATVNDLETLYRIERECFTVEAFTKTEIAYLLEAPNAVSLIARVDDEIAGFTIGLIHDYGEIRAGHVYTIDVAIKHRRKGVGLRLLKELEQIFIKRGVKICYLEARLDNVAAQELYRKHGYAEVGTLRDYYSRGTHGIRFVKGLS